jgi:membrane-associated phospholipid phosphatase
MFSLIKKNSAFFIPYLLFLLISGITLLSFSKPDIAFFINQHHCPAADFFFKYWTNIGLGYLIFPIAIILAFVRFRYMITAIIAFLITVTINDSIKQIAATPRPQIVFQDLHRQLYFVPGVDIYSSNSFPSGHTAISFAMFCLLALVAKKPALKFLLFIMAFLVAYSRMYLSEHFLIDVYVASFIGIVCALLSFKLVANWKWLNKFASMDKPLIRI